MPNPAIPSQSTKSTPPVRLCLDLRGLPPVERDLWHNYESTLIKDYNVLANINRRLISCETHKTSVQLELDFLREKLQVQHSRAPGLTPPVLVSTQPSVPSNQSASDLVMRLRRKVHKLKVSLHETRGVVNKLDSVVATLQGQVATLLIPQRSALCDTTGVGHNHPSSRKPRKPPSKLLQVTHHTSFGTATKDASASPRPITKAHTGEESEALDVHASPHLRNKRRSSSSSSSSAAGSAAVSSSDEGECDTDPVSPKRHRK